MIINFMLTLSLQTVLTYSSLPDKQAQVAKTTWRPHFWDPINIIEMFKIFNF